MNFTQILLVLQIHDIKQMDHCILQLCYMSKAFQAYLSTQKFRKEGQEQPRGGTPP